jgi:hypothetical protein
MITTDRRRSTIDELSPSIDDNNRCRTTLATSDDDEDGNGARSFADIQSQLTLVSNSLLALVDPYYQRTTTTTTTTSPPTSTIKFEVD